MALGIDVNERQSPMEPGELLNEGSQILDGDCLSNAQVQRFKPSANLHPVTPPAGGVLDDKEVPARPPWLSDLQDYGDSFGCEGRNGIVFELRGLLLHQQCLFRIPGGAVVSSGVGRPKMVFPIVNGKNLG